MVTINQSTLDMLKAGEKPFAKKKNKFNAKKEISGGKLIDSGREATRLRELELQQHCGIIYDLKTQVLYQLVDDFEHKDWGKIKGIRYRADFVYLKNGKKIVEDSKGYRTRHYIDKRKMLLSRYPEINFIET